MAEADRHAVARRQVAEESEALVAAAHDVHDGREPVLILRLDAQLSLPLRIEQVAIRLRAAPRASAASCCRPAPTRTAASPPTACAAGRSRAAGRRAPATSIGSRIFSRASASISGEPKWITSTSYRPAAASAIVRCRTAIGPRAPDVDLDAVLRFEGLTSVGRSFSAIVV